MLDEIGGATSQLVQLALDAAVQKHKVIANNIANANTPGYTPQTLDFEDHISIAEAQHAGDPEKLLQLQIAYMRPLLENGSLVVPSGDNKVQLDMQMKELAENTIHYEALLAGLGKRSSIIGMAISEQGGK